MSSEIVDQPTSSVESRLTEALINTNISSLQEGVSGKPAIMGVDTDEDILIMVNIRPHYSGDDTRNAVCMFGVMAYADLDITMMCYVESDLYASLGEPVSDNGRDGIVVVTLTSGKLSIKRLDVKLERTRNHGELEVTRLGEIQSVGAAHPVIREMLKVWTNSAQDRKLNRIQVIGFLEEKGYRVSSADFF